jgi:hypothetical protein
MGSPNRLVLTGAGLQTVLPLPGRAGPAVASLDIPLPVARLTEIWVLSREEWRSSKRINISGMKYRSRPLPALPFPLHSF